MSSTSSRPSRPSMSSTPGADVARPAPNARDPLYQPYVRGLAEHKLLVQRCASCGHWQWPPRDFCFVCHQAAFVWAEVPPEGVVYTYTVSYRAFHPWFRAHVPYGIVDAEVGPGVRILAPCFDSDVESLECGQPVRAAFDDVAGVGTLLRWTRS